MLTKEENELLTQAGNMLIFPNVLRFAYSMHWRVPMDDTHTHIFTVTFDPSQMGSDLENPPIDDHPVQYLPNGRHSMKTIWAPDRMAWETQGKVTDWRKEHLGTSDRGIIMLRQLLKDQIARTQEGLDPLGVVRDPDCDIIELPLDQYLEKLPEGMERVRSSWDYFDERQEWFEVPEGAARRPGVPL